MPEIILNISGLINHGIVTMRKGVFANDNSFWDWYNKIKMNTIERQNFVIKLIDESGNPTMIWSIIEGLSASWRMSAIR
jgi:phage tail-like protein